LPRLQSAGVLAYRRRNGALEVLLVHPGGPFWQRKDDGAWSIPKGEFSGDELPEAAARREFTEETGATLPDQLIALTPIAQSRGKVVHPFAVEADIDADALRSNMFTLEWPPRSGVMREFPEIDRAAWYSLADAQRKIIAGQRPILTELAERLTHGQE
jgi:predicted NUDIX family NTP pyrophosphohydrolase